MKFNLDNYNLKEISDNDLLNIYDEFSKEQESQESMSLIRKTFLNSFYGAGALDSNPFSNGKMTNASVTMFGRMWIMMTGMVLSNQVRKDCGLPETTELTEIIQGDTDSQYLVLDRLIEQNMVNSSEEEIIKFLQDYFKNTLEPLIIELMDQMNINFNLYSRKVLKMDQEVITNSFCSVASKRYFCRVKVNDGVVLNKPKNKVTGISLISKSTPSGVKEVLKPILDYILDHDESGMQEYIQTNMQKFATLRVGEMSKTSGVSKTNGFFFTDKNKRRIDNWKNASKVMTIDEKRGLVTAPIMSRGAVTFNTLLDELGLGNKYEKIVDSDQIKCVYLQIPNPITGTNNFIGFKDERFIYDTGLDQFIDFDIQWQKEMIDKIKILNEATKWNVEQVNTLDDW